MSCKHLQVSAAVHGKVGARPGAGPSAVLFPRLAGATRATTASPASHREPADEDPVACENTVADESSAELVLIRQPLRSRGHDRVQAGPARRLRTHSALPSRLPSLLPWADLRSAKSPRRLQTSKRLCALVGQCATVPLLYVASPNAAQAPWRGRTVPPVGSSTRRLRSVWLARRSVVQRACAWLAEAGRQQQPAAAQRRCPLSPGRAARPMTWRVGLWPQLLHAPLWQRRWWARRSGVRLFTSALGVGPTLCGLEAVVQPVT